MSVQSQLQQPVSRPRDWLIAFALAVTFCGLYAVTRRSFFFNDGWQLTTILARSGTETPVWMHVLYLPCAKLVERLTGASSLESLRWLSVVAGGLGLAGTYSLGCALRLPRRGIIPSVVLLGGSAALWFHSTIVELHSFHFCFVAWSGLLASKAGRWRSAPAVLGLALACCLCYLSHRSGALLLPGMACLFVVSAREAGRLGMRIFALAALGSILGFCVALVAANLALTGELGLGVTATNRVIEQFRRGFSWRYLWEDVLSAAGLVLAAGLVGWVVLFKQETRRVACALSVLILPSVVFFAWFGEPNMGGYILSVAPFLCVLGAALPWRRVPLVLVGVALSTQFVGGWMCVRSDEFAELETIARERTLAVDAVLASGGGTLISMDSSLQTVNGRSASTVELSQWSLLQKVASTGRAPADFSRYVIELARRRREEGHGPVVVDVSFELVSVGYPRLEAYGANLVLMFEQTFECERSQHGQIVLLLLGAER